MRKVCTPEIHMDAHYCMIDIPHALKRYLYFTEEKLFKKQKGGDVAEPEIGIEKKNI